MTGSTLYATGIHILKDESGKFCYVCSPTTETNVGNFVFILFYFCTCMNVLSACRFVHPCRAMSQRSEEDVGFP